MIVAGPFLCEECDAWFDRPGPGQPPKACPECRPQRAVRRTTEWQKANPERNARNQAKTWAKYYVAHREELIAKSVERSRRNPERKQASNAKRYALTRGAPNAELFTLDEIYLRDEGVCHLCDGAVDRSDASMDHIIPVTDNGPHTLANVALAHFSCNSSRKTMPVDEWRERHLTTRT